MNAILVGFDGKKAMLRAIFGSSDDESKAKAETSVRPMTPELFAALFE